METIYEKYMALPIDKGLLCLENGDITEPYFCYPVNAKPIGFEGCILYCFLPEYGEMVFACNPESCADQNVYPLAATFEDFIRLILACGTANPVEQIVWMDKNKFEEHIVYFYTDISRFFLQRAKERYKECDGKIEMHYQTLDIDEAFSSQLPSNFQADIVIAVGVLNNSVNTDKCIYEINSVMKPGGILLIIETVEDVPDILITQSFMMTEPKDQRKATNTMFLNRKQWLEILEENGFCNSEEFPGYGEYLEVLGQKLFYCTKE